MKNEQNETMDPITNVVTPKTQARILLAQSRQEIHDAIDSVRGDKGNDVAAKRALHRALSKIDTAEKLIQFKLRTK